MKLMLLPKAPRARQASYAILISLLFLMLFYTLDEFLLKGSAEGFIWILLNIIVIISWLFALFGTILGILSIYKTKEMSVLLLGLLFMGFTFSIFGLLDLFIPQS